MATRKTIDVQIASLREQLNELERVESTSERTLGSDELDDEDRKRFEGDLREAKEGIAKLRARIEALLEARKTAADE